MQEVTFNGSVLFNNTVKTCTTPGVTDVIQLRMALPGDFGGVNSTAKPENFSIDLTDCGPYLSAVQYRLLGSPGNTEPNNGILPVGTGTTAQGYQVQVVRQNGATIPFGTWHNVAGYNPATGSNISIPLQARYIQTSTNVTGGTVKAAMIFQIQYP